MSKLFSLLSVLAVLAISSFSLANEKAAEPAAAPVVMPADQADAAAEKAKN